MSWINPYKNTYTPKWIITCLLLAGFYNMAWGLWVSLFPFHFFDITGLIRPHYSVIWQGMGMVIGLYGLGYAIAAYDPIRFWPLIFIGFLGKIIGPIGFAFYYFKGEFPGVFIYQHIFNDAIWWVPFGIILFWVLKNTQKTTI